MPGSLFRILFIALCLSLPAALYSGAWTQKRGGLFTRVAVLRFEATSQFTLEGTREALADNGRVVDLGIYHYLEYGLFDDLSLVTNFGYKRIAFSCAVEDCGNSSVGFSDVYLGVRYRLAQSPWVWSLQTGVKLPTGYETDEEKLDSAPPLGDGQTDLEFRLLTGRSILNYRAYVNFELAYRIRSGEPVDEMHFLLEAGLNLTRDYLFIATLYGVQGLSETAGQDDFRLVNGRVVNFVGMGAVEEFTNVRLQLVYRIARTVDLSFELNQVLAGRNTSLATTVGGGLALRF